MQTKSSLLAFAMLLGLVASTLAQDGKVKNEKQIERVAKGTAKQLMTFYKSAELTEEQTEKAMAIIKEFAPKIIELKAAQDKMLNDEQKQARKEAREAATKEGLKGPKLNEAGMKALNLSDEQMKAFQEAGKKVSALNGEIKKAINKTLTEEQIAKLPKSDNKNKGKGKGKKKEGKEGDGKDGDTQNVSLKLPNMT